MEFSRVINNVSQIQLNDHHSNNIQFNSLVQKRIQDAINLFQGMRYNLNEINETLNVLGQLFKSESVVLNAVQGAFGLSLCSAFKKLLSSQKNKHVNKMAVLVLGRILKTHQEMQTPENEPRLNKFQQNDLDDPFLLTNNANFTNIESHTPNNPTTSDIPTSTTQMSQLTQFSQSQSQNVWGTNDFRRLMNNNNEGMNENSQMITQNNSQFSQSFGLSQPWFNDLSQLNESSDGIPACFLKSDLLKALCSLLASSDVQFFNINLRFISLLISESKLPLERFTSTIEAVLRSASMFIRDKAFDKDFWIYFYKNFLISLTATSKKIEQQVSSLSKHFSSEWIQSNLQNCLKDLSNKTALGALITSIQISIDFKMPLLLSFKERRMFDKLVKIMNHQRSFGGLGLEFTLKILDDCLTPIEFETLFLDNSDFLKFLEKRLILDIKRNHREMGNAFKIIEVMYSKNESFKIPLNVTLKWSITTLFPDIQYLFRTIPSSLRFLTALLSNGFRSSGNFIEVLEYKEMPQTLVEALQNVQFHIGSLFYRVMTLEFESLLWDCLHSILKFAQREMNRPTSPFHANLDFLPELLFNPWLPHYISMALGRVDNLFQLDLSILRFTATWTKLIIQKMEAGSDQIKNLLGKSNYPFSYSIIFAHLKKKIINIPEEEEEPSNLRLDEDDELMDQTQDPNREKPEVKREKRKLISRIWDHVEKYSEFSSLSGRLIRILPMNIDCGLPMEEDVVAPVVNGQVNVVDSEFTQFNPIPSQNPGPSQLPMNPTRDTQYPINPTTVRDTQHPTNSTTTFGDTQQQSVSLLAGRNGGEDLSQRAKGFNSQFFDEECTQF